MRSIRRLRRTARRSTSTAARCPTPILQSFEVLDGSFARDARHAYWMGKPIPDADGSTFRVLNANFECTADRTHAYYRDTVIVGARPALVPGGTFDHGVF
jgi:hypothetical protein